MRASPLNAKEPDQSHELIRAMNIEWFGKTSSNAIGIKAQKKPREGSRTLNPHMLPAPRPLQSDGDQCFSDELVFSMSFGNGAPQSEVEGESLILTSDIDSQQQEESKKLSQSSFKRTRKPPVLALGPSLLPVRDDELEEEALPTNIASSVPKGAAEFPLASIFSEVSLVRNNGAAGIDREVPGQPTDQPESIGQEDTFPLIMIARQFTATPSFPIAAAVPQPSRSLTNSMNGNRQGGSSSLRAEAEFPPISSAPIHSFLEQDMPIVPNFYLSETIHGQRSRSRTQKS